MKKLFLFLFFVLVPGAASAQEQLCLNLGADCLCAETLDEGVATIIPGAHAFWDPPSSTAKECNGGPAFFRDNTKNQGFIAASTVNFPGSASSVMHILYNTLDYRASFEDTERIFTDQTYCVRKYFKMSQGFPTPTNSNQNVKMGRNEKPPQLAVSPFTKYPHPGMEAAWKDGSPTSTPRIGLSPSSHQSSFGIRPTLPRSGNVVSFQDCKDYWCRVEWCYDHNSRAAPDDNKLVWRGRVQTIDANGNVVETENHGPALSPDADTWARSGTTTQPFSTNASGANGDSYHPTGESEYHAYVMVAIKDPADETFWIGPACEVEGGCAAATPTSTPTSTPITPTATPTTSPTGTPTATPTATPPSGIVLCQMDFEGDGCLDGASGDTCDSSAGGRSIAYGTNCSSGTSACPLVGTRSGYAYGNGGIEDTMWMDTSMDCTADKTKVTVDFKLRFPADANTVRSDQFRIMTTPGQYGTAGYAMKFRPSTQELMHVCGPSGNSVNTFTLPSPSPNPAEDVTYNVRVNFDAANYTCAIYIDDEADGLPWGTGDNWSACGAGATPAPGCDVPQLNSSATGGVFAGIWHSDGATENPSIIDNIGICEATGAFMATGTKCGPTPTPTGTPTATPTPGGPTPTSTPTATPTGTPTSTPTATPPVVHRIRQGKQNTSRWNSFSNWIN